MCNCACIITVHCLTTTSREYLPWTCGFVHMFVCVYAYVLIHVCMYVYPIEIISWCYCSFLFYVAIINGDPPLAVEQMAN